MESQSLPSKLRCSFELINADTNTFKIVENMDHHLKLAPPPSPHTKDEVVTLVSGKYPLNDYHDLSIHTYTFVKSDGSQFTGLLESFTYDCTFEGQGKSLGTPLLTLLLD